MASRKVFSGGNVFSNLTTTERDAVQRNHNVRIGLDYELSDKTILGVLFNTYDNRWSMNAFNQNTAAKNNVSTQFIELMNDEVNLWQHAVLISMSNKMSLNRLFGRSTWITYIIKMTIPMTITIASLMSTTTSSELIWPIVPS
ncbi:MAG: hypothetical protein IPJ09_21275 [Saprospiraceae bacterium]|nr:hypothetical protein [Saprospiraceae bacterium]